MRVFITGTSRGFGSVLVNVFREHGHIVYAATRADGNLSNYEGQRTTCEAMIKFNPDVLINNAAVKYQPVGEQMAINFTAPWFLSQHAINGGTKAIINIGSSCEYNPHPDDVTYATTKAALHKNSNLVKDDRILHGVRVMDVIIGAMKVGMNSSRKDFDSLIDPIEVAEIIEHLCHSKTFYTREIHIGRVNHNDI
jgi:NAD(P)-dependent dehydrogenase (short-subunit alcohol dehydrogenase family)